MPISHIMSGKALHIASDESLREFLPATAPRVVFGCVARLLAHRPCSADWCRLQCPLRAAKGTSGGSRVLAVSSARARPVDVCSAASTPADVVLDNMQESNMAGYQ